MLAALLPTLAVSCGSAPEPAGSPARPIVAVSVVPQAWLVERLAGGLVDVVVMVPPGASPATHEPGIEGRRAIADAALYVKVGHPHFPFEAAWLDRLLDERPGLPVVDCAAGLEALAHDPHLWLSPTRMLSIAPRLADALVIVLPGEVGAIRARESSLEGELRATEVRLREILSHARGKTFVVLHPAWSYLADDYELEQLAIQFENREPDPRRLAALIGRAKSLGIRVVFGQPHFDSTSARVVAEEIGARVELLDPLAEDWPANLEHVAERLAKEARG